MNTVPVLYAVGLPFFVRKFTVFPYLFIIETA